MPHAEFELSTPATQRPQTYALDSAATGIGILLCVLSYYFDISLYRPMYVYTWRSRAWSTAALCKGGVSRVHITEIEWEIAG
jgi:hypothetical protein